MVNKGLNGIYSVGKSRNASDSRRYLADKISDASAIWLLLFQGNFHRSGVRLHLAWVFYRASVNDD
jgi:hypothetical protein